jgi:hypothetical protein
MKIGIIVSLALLLTGSVFGQIRINPSDDGYIYYASPSPNYVNHVSYVFAYPDDTRGAMVFPAFDTSMYTTISLAVNPYGLPLHDQTVEVYAYDFAESQIMPDDYDKGSLLGTLNIPSTIGFGEDTLLDVTTFVSAIKGPHFGFILRVDEGGDVFSSLEFNYGHPCGLIAIPEPGAFSLLSLGMASIVALTSNHKIFRRV